MTNQGATVTVLYPRDEHTFDINYYNSTHMPLVSKHWNKFGLKSWTVTKFNDDAPYTYAAAMEWESTEALQKAFGDETAKEIMADVANFTKSQPTIISGSIVCRSS